MGNASLSGVSDLSGSKNAPEESRVSLRVPQEVGNLSDFAGTETNSANSTKLDFEEGKMVYFTLNAKQYRTKVGTTILRLKIPVGERIPSICFHTECDCFEKRKETDHFSECELSKVLVRNDHSGNLCYSIANRTGRIVEYSKETEGDCNGRFDFVRSCVTEVTPNAEIFTHFYENSKDIRFQQAIRNFLTCNLMKVLEKLKKLHVFKCDECIQPKETCSIHRIFSTYIPTAIQGNLQMEEEGESEEEDCATGISQSVQFRDEYCVDCTRCMRICPVLNVSKTCQEDLEDLGSGIGRNLEAFKDQMFRKPSTNLPSCIDCGMCSQVCPTIGITENRDDQAVSKLLAISRDERIPKREKKAMIAIVDTTFITSFFEDYGFRYTYTPNTQRERLMCHILRTVGFDCVFDASQCADLHIVETSKELVTRISNGGPWPLITSNCPSSNSIIKKYFPEQLQNLSIVKPPYLILASMVKNKWSKLRELRREQIVVTYLTSCVAAKSEISNLRSAKLLDLPIGSFSVGELELPKGQTDVDFVITPREFSSIARPHFKPPNTISPALAAEVQEEEGRDVDFDDLFTELFWEDPSLLSSSRDQYVSGSRYSGSSSDSQLFGISGFSQSVVNIVATSPEKQDSSKQKQRVSFIEPSVLTGSPKNIRIFTGFEIPELKKKQEFEGGERHESMNEIEESKSEKLDCVILNSSSSIFKFFGSLSGNFNRPVLVEASVCSGGCVGGPGSTKTSSRSRVRQRMEYLMACARSRSHVCRTPLDSFAAKLCFSRNGSLMNRGDALGREFYLHRSFGDFKKFEGRKQVSVRKVKNEEDEEEAVKETEIVVDDVTTTADAIATVLSEDTSNTNTPRSSFDLFSVEEGEIEVN